MEHNHDNTKQVSMIKEKTALTTTKIDCEITKENFDDMQYYWDSGMFDITTKNPAVFALNSKLKPGHKVRILREGSDGSYCCEIDEQRYQIECDLEEVFECAEFGIQLEGFHFSAQLPDAFLR